MMSPSSRAVRRRERRILDLTGDNVIMPKRAVAIAFPVAMALITAACGGSEDPRPQAQAPGVPLSCAQMTDQTVSAAQIALPTTGARVTAAQVVAASGTGAAADAAGAQMLRYRQSSEPSGLPSVVPMVAS